MTSKDKEALLQNKLFSKIPSELFEKNVKVVPVKKGETFMSKENFRRGLAVIIKGKARVTKVSLDGKRTDISSLSAGDVFGMATLFYEEDSFPSEITAEAPLRLAIFKKEFIEAAFYDYPEFAKAYAILLSEKIHFLNKKLSSFTEGDDTERVLRWILSTAEGKSEIEFCCPVSKLASMLGIGRASVYRAFDALEDRGEIEKVGKKIVILKQ